MSEKDDTRLSLLRLGKEIEIDREFVAREAGDEPMTEEEQLDHTRVRHGRGERFFCDLLFVLTHTPYEPERAETLWLSILQHKTQLNHALGRNVGIAVAALDFLSNVCEELDHAVLLDEHQIESVAALATQDAMTGLADHSTFQLTLRREFRRAERYARKLSVIMLDVDHFKRFNDQHGHPAGDRVLKKLAQLMREHVRQVDTPCRYGGEEFAIIAPATGKSAAHALAERLRTEVEQTFATMGVTISLGVASFPIDALDKQDLVEAADQALYRSKREGRNQTTDAPPRT